jgi:hypothetical protein
MMISGRSKKAKHLGTDRRWTLLFIGDHGNVIALKRFKAIVIAAAFIFFSAICAVAVLFFVNHDTVAENKELQGFVEKSKTQIEALRHEKEVLMARLVIAESNTNKRVAKDRQSQAEINTANQITPKPQAVSKQPAGKVDQNIPPVPEIAQPKPVAAETVQPKPLVAETAQPKAAAAETVEPEPAMSVAVENFSVFYEPGSENLNAQFKIKNTGSQSQPVSGRTVVVLKGDDLSTQQWLVMPAVALVGDMPSGTRGKTFSIRRFRTMNFTFKTPARFDAFQTAVVYVFLKSGELLLEEDFPVTLPPPPVPAIQAPAAETPSPQTSRGETPAGDDSADSSYTTPFGF